MNRFVEWLEQLNETDSRVRAVLRQSLSFEPGEYIPAFCHIEPLLKGEEKYWQRRMLYLVAGLWAMHWRLDRSGIPISIGKACAAHQKATDSTSTEKRFIALLDSDDDQLPHRLRQMISLLKKQHIDFTGLLKGLTRWQDERKRVQQAWARDYYQNL
jgi:CRISPR system Cascade subunit CasB